MAIFARAKSLSMDYKLDKTTKSNENFNCYTVIDA